MIFYPPKPTLITIDQPLFDDLDKDPNVIAELKYNGNNLVLKRFAPCLYEFWNRHGAQFKYKPSKKTLDELDLLNWRGECICNGELRHNKVVGVKDQIVLWDVFVWDKENLKSRIFSDRRFFYLENLFYNRTTENIKISQIWKEGFKELFYEKIVDPEIEGLVMKRLDAPLILGTKSSPEVKYMFKVRKPNANYRW